MLASEAFEIIELVKRSRNGISDSARYSKSGDCIYFEWLDPDTQEWGNVRVKTIGETLKVLAREE